MNQPIALMTAAGTRASGLGAPSPSGDTSRPQMQRAVLRMYDPSPSKSGSGGTPGASRGEVKFQFNPKEVSITKAAKWERKTAKGAKKAGPPEFSGSEPCKLTVEMFFDATATHDGSVVRAVESLFSCCVPTEESAGQKKPSPPLVVLHWGSISSFPAFVTSVSAKYTLFSPEGTPIRALCNVALEEMPDEPWRQNPTSGGRSVRRAHQMVAGDTLASVAYTEYGAPAPWRRRPADNPHDDPMRLRPGTTLLLPTATDLG